MSSSEWTIAFSSCVSVLLFNGKNVTHVYEGKLSQTPEGALWQTQVGRMHRPSSSYGLSVIPVHVKLSIRLVTKKLKESKKLFFGAGIMQSYFTSGARARVKTTTTSSNKGKTIVVAIVDCRPIPSIVIEQTSQKLHIGSGQLVWSSGLHITVLWHFYISHFSYLFLN